ncbi:MAG: biotin/lipoyl-binding protein [Candidatus Viridilinea halotolerans]|uniref:Biotin/lipoyl-binding protein n=1 Tax=Candidatus Viridilinea halotolerans TaxID=2491704 RepID=A0A426TV42_9CHLR|nr:MAG: biotin/lipoyl-binding protein [Candidatus Viridilinea halotolerans]
MLRKVLFTMLFVGAFFFMSACGQADGATGTTGQAAEPTVIPPVQAAAAVIAEGKVMPASSVNLNFEMTGTVAELLVAEGDAVVAGQPLARLDTRDLELRVAQAQVGIEQAQADYDRLLEGATPEQVAAAQAEIARAQGSYRSTQNSVTGADVTAAQAELESARARLAQLQAGPKEPDLASAQAAIDQAQANLTSQRDNLSRAKVDAELRVTTAGNALRNAQDNYSRIYWENIELDRASDDDLPQARLDAEAAALRNVHDGETALAQAQLAWEQAQRAEQSGIAAAEAQVRDAQARYDRLMSPTDADAIAAARAQVAAAQARIASLTGGQREGNVAAAQAGIAAAQARLAEIQADPSEAQLAAAAARVRSAEVGLRQAELTLEQATLVAPMGGAIAQLNLKVGEVPNQSQAAIVIADLSNWQIETEDLSELSIVQVREGDAVIIGFDALPDFTLQGTVSAIKPLGQNRQGDIVYTVVVEPTSWDERLRWNMTATVRIGAE